MSNNVPYLCGGIFFDLLLQARKNRAKARNKMDGGTDGLSDTDVLKGLVYVVTASEVKVSGKTFAKATSQYKSCQISDNTYIPFKDAVTITAFDEEYKNKLPDVIARMTQFVLTFLNEKKIEWLIKALLDVILTDETIPGTAEFKFTQTSSIKKDDITDSQYIVDSIDFLTSVLHYIITERPDNEKGKPTFEKWFTRNSAYTEWKFDSDIGSNFKSTIKCSSYMSLAFLAGTPKSGKTKRIDSLGAIARTNGFTSLVADMMKSDEEPFTKYLERAKDFHSKVKTLLYSEKPHSFYDFYVCNSLSAPRVTLTPDRPIPPHSVDNITVAQLWGLSNYVIISGTGGIGKTMMMRHLLLSGIDEFSETAKLPILVSLKNYSSDCDLKTFIYQTVKALDYNIAQEQIDDMLDNGNCLILLDGLDEVISSLRDKFEMQLENLTVRYPDNYFIISSRPTTQFLSYKRFTVYKIDEFTKEQSLALVDKLDYYNVEAKAKFRADLDARLFKSHYQFASNPLLLTIMLMTYSSIGDIPRKMHIFYSKAYETMARLHDATKGAYVRPLNTGLEPEEFAKYFAEFCARTYRDEVLEFTVQTFCEYMDKVIEHKGEGLKCTARDFLLDLKDNLCIMYEEGDKYYFIHRSFQEYFSAVFFSSQMDDKLPLIAEQFKDLHQKSYHDKTFDMLYDMIPQRIDRYIFTPYLKNLWGRCDTDTGYWTFLRLMYPTIYSYTGDAGDFYENTPEEYFYDFIVNETLIRQNGQLDDLDWPERASIFKTEFVSIVEEARTADGMKLVSRTVEYESREYDLYAEEQGEDYEPDFCGASWTIEVSDLFNDPIKYKAVFEFIESDDFPLKKEYNLMRSYSEKLFEKFAKPKPVPSDDWFQNF